MPENAHISYAFKRGTYVKILRQKYGNSTSEAADLVLGVVGADGQDLQVIASRLGLHGHCVAHL